MELGMVLGTGGLEVRGQILPHVTISQKSNNKNRKEKPKGLHYHKMKLLVIFLIPSDILTQYKLGDG